MHGDSHMEQRTLHHLIRFAGVHALVRPFVTFAVSIIIARALGPEGRGAYGIALAIIATGPVLVSLGLDVAVRYWCALGQAGTRRILKTSTIIGLLFGLLVAGLAAISWWTKFPRAFVPVSLGWLGAAALVLTLCLTTLTNFWNNYLIGHERYAYGTWGTTLGTVLQMTLLIMLWRFSALTLDTAVLALSFETIFVFVLFMCLPQISLRGAFKESPLSAGELQKMLRYGRWHYFSALLSLTTLQLTVFLLAALGDLHETGLFTAVVGPANLIFLLGAPLNLVLSARSTRRMGDPGFPHKVAVALRLLLAVTTVAAVLFAVVAPVVIPWMFGEPFRNAVVVFQILLPGVAAMVLKNVILQYLGGSGHPQWNTAISATNASVSVVLNLALIPSLGAVGAATAISIAHSCSLLFSVYAFLRLTRLRLSELLIYRATDWLPLARVAGITWKDRLTR